MTTEPNTAARGSRRSYHHGDLRNALIEASERRIQIGGADAFTLEAAAAEVGVSRAAPYRHFNDRSEVLAAIAMRGFARLSSAFEGIPANLSARERLLEHGIAYVVAARGDPHVFKLMFAAPFTATMNDSAADNPGLDAYSALVNAVTAAGMKDPDETAVGLWAIAHGIAMLAIDGLVEMDDTRLRRLLANALPGTHPD
jgi:AcrR family transcriptional regulator